ncbi:putative nucleoside diphosphate kinase 5 [Drosera capensis]
MATSACTFTVAAAMFSSESVLDEKTLAIIKPDGVYGNYSDMIKDSIHESGFMIAREQRIQLDEDTIRSFYAEHSSKSFFASLF